VSSRVGVDVAEQNVNLHDSVHVGDVVQNVTYNTNSTVECPACRTANVVVFTCTIATCDTRWCTFCGTRKPGLCAEDEKIRALERDRLTALTIRRQNLEIAILKANNTIKTARSKLSDAQRVLAKVELNKSSQRESKAPSNVEFAPMFTVGLVYLTFFSEKGGDLRVILNIAALFLVIIGLLKAVESIIDWRKISDDERIPNRIAEFEQTIRHNEDNIGFYESQLREVNDEITLVRQRKG